MFPRYAVYSVGPRGASAPQLTTFPRGRCRPCSFATSSLSVYLMQPHGCPLHGTRPGVRFFSLPTWLCESHTCRGLRRHQESQCKGRGAYLRVASRPSIARVRCPSRLPLALRQARNFDIWTHGGVDAGTTWNGSPTEMPAVCLGVVESCHTPSSESMHPQCRHIRTLWATVPRFRPPQALLQASLECTQGKRIVFTQFLSIIIIRYTHQLTGSLVCIKHSQRVRGMRFVISRLKSKIFCQTGLPKRHSMLPGCRILDCRISLSDLHNVLPVFVALPP